MPPLKIIVTGKSFVTHGPERGALTFSVKSKGAEQETVAKEVISASNNIQTWFKSTFFTSESATESPVTKFSSTSIRTWTKSSDRYDEPVPNPHNASISFHAVFRDFAKLNHAIEQLLAYPKVEIDSLGWSLTDETGSGLASEARKLALRDAIQQAEDYSQVLGRSVAVVEIADHGMSPYRAVRHMKQAAVEYHGSEPTPLDLTPQDIDVEAHINVTFEAVSDV